MKKHRLSHCPDYCETSGFGCVEKSGEYLLDFAGLPEASNCCTISLKEAYGPKGGAIMAEMTKQSEGKEELLRQNKETLIAAIQSSDNEYLIQSTLTYMLSLKRVLGEK